MVRRAALFVAMFFLAISVIGSAHASESYPLNQTIGGSISSGDDLTIETACLVTKKEDTYTYAITVTYKSNTRRLLSWNYLDWILSQYPNALKSRYANPHLFPLAAGSGRYLFIFDSKEKPVLFEHTHLEIFPYEITDAEMREKNNRMAEEYSGVRVFSHNHNYNYLSAQMRVGMSSCLPENLGVFSRR